MPSGQGGGGIGGMGLGGGGGGGGATTDSAARFGTMRQPPHQFQAPTVGQLSFMDALPSLMAYAKIGQGVSPSFAQFGQEPSFLPPPVPEITRPAPPIPPRKPSGLEGRIRRRLPPTVGEGRR